MINEITGLDINPTDKVFHTGRERVKARIAAKSFDERELEDNPSLSNMRAFDISGSVVDDQGKAIAYEHGRGGFAIAPYHFHAIHMGAVATAELVLVNVSSTEPTVSIGPAGIEKPLKEGHAWFNPDTGEMKLYFEKEWYDLGQVPYSTPQEQSLAQIELNMHHCRLNCTRMTERWWAGVQLMDVVQPTGPRPSYSDLEAEIVKLKARVDETQAALDEQILINNSAA